MDPSYSLSQVQEERIPSFRGVGENVASLPDYSDFHDGLDGWPGDCGRKESAGNANRSHPLRVAIRCQAVDSGASQASTVWRQVATSGERGFAAQPTMANVG
jgi:hypothetical protein